MNYEDRADLKDPQEILSPDFFAKLNSVTFNSKQSTFATVHVSESARRVFDKIIKLETETQGAPTETEKVCRGMLQAGYGFGLILLPDSSSYAIAPEELFEKLQNMYVYGLEKYLIPNIVAPIISDELENLVSGERANLYLFEEASNEWWWSGLAAAFIERDVR